MFFNNKTKIDEDLEKIRFANLPYDKQKEELNKLEADKKKIQSIQYEKSDRLAFIIASFSIVIPLVLIFVAVVAIFVGLFYWWF